MKQKKSKHDGERGEPKIFLIILLKMGENRTNFLNCWGGGDEVPGHYQLFLISSNKSINVCYCIRIVDIREIDFV